jgi:hypothetical protein
MNMDDVREFVVKQIGIYSKLKERTQEQQYFQGMIDGLREVLTKIDNMNSFF